ncbi:uncharacterized protein LOC131647680 isoform X2 [Vicia villosa]|uniref:uncharacterized protein LOC131647680 isoform X2 n=1 Tax=Vicia villosa TaxID=3911 RepID=UPI00273AE148|nr:uncharacterized protein LOC131647680 isoform X2 [Vicia villosa]
MTNAQARFCMRPSQTTKVRLRLHHRGRFVNEPVKLYVGGEVSEMTWKLDVDYLSYMDIEGLVRDHGYVDIENLWYRNPKFSFTRGIRPLNNDNDVLQFGQDVVGHELIDIYVEHKVSAPPEIVEDYDDEEDEDHLYTPPGSDDEEDVEKFPTYKSGEGCVFKIGMMFTNKETIRDAIKEYGMENQKNVYINKNDSKRIVVKCMDGCNFHLRFSMRNGQNYWQIVSYVSDHTCYRTADNRNAKTQWLAIRFTQILRHSPYMKPAGLVAEALQRWGTKISTDQAYRAKRKALDLIQGAGFDQFRHLRSYAEELLKSNPKSTVIIKCAENNGNPTFERIYICLDACKSGFATYCRPIIGLDACFLKGDYGGQLMSAIGRDGNNQIYPIAYAVVEAETKDSWEWFLHLLLEDLRAFNDRCYGFISDQQKGLVPAIQGLSGNVEQRMCVKHLYGNWKKKHPGLVLKQAMWAAARATSIPVFERAMEKLKLLDPVAWKDMNDIPAKFWTRAYFQTYSKCDIQVNNMCEAFNRAILEHRDKPIITLLEGIKHYITKRITKQKGLLQGYEGVICPRIQLILEKNKKEAQDWTPTWHGDDDLSIFGVTNGTETYCVNMKNESCSCRKWELSGIPCCHVISCIWNIRKRPEGYVSPYYSKLTFGRSYANIVFPTNGPQLWTNADHVPMCPPIMRRAIGRPKKMRNKTADEPKNPYVLSKKFATVTCNKCGQAGHNKRTCKGKRAADRQIPKGGNKAKKAKTTKKAKKTKDKQNHVEIGQGSQAPQPTQD